MSWLRWRGLLAYGRVQLVVFGFRLEVAIVAKLARLVGFDAFEEENTGCEVDLREARQPDAVGHPRLLE
ncbi:MAG: hypothetical protein ICV68_13615, partial [Pyrinomonadaceae bacterium]|nr:hypothetical protein [Pyrinomonadaceae bacterium]